MLAAMAPSNRRLSTASTGCLVLLLVAGCGSAPGRSDPTGVDGLQIPTASPDPNDFVDGIDNRFLPLAPGSRWMYESTSSTGDELITVTVMNETRVVSGVTTTVVHDRVTARGGRVQDTYRWFAQDRAGNVWHFGEDTTSYDDGGPSTQGSWEAGVDGARAGVAMLAAPRVGDGYQQGLAAGEAEDQSEVLAIDADVTLDLESFAGALKIADTTPLEPGLIQHAYYGVGVGRVLAETVAGGDERIVLVEYDAG